MDVIDEVRWNLVLPSVFRSPACGADLSFWSILSGNISYERLAGVDPLGYGASSRVVGSPGQKENRVDHDTVEEFPATLAQSRQTRPDRSSAIHQSFDHSPLWLNTGLAT